jgi:hypothetical protein
MNGATVLVVKGLRLIDRPRLGLPERLMFHHGVEDRQELAHTGRQRHLRRLAGGP